MPSEVPTSFLASASGCPPGLAPAQLAARCRTPQRGDTHSPGTPSDSWQQTQRSWRERAVRVRGAQSWIPTERQTGRFKIQDLDFSPSELGIPMIKASTGIPKCRDHHGNFLKARKVSIVWHLFRWKLPQTQLGLPEGLCLHSPSKPQLQVRTRISPPTIPCWFHTESYLDGLQYFCHLNGDTG